MRYFEYKDGVLTQYDTGWMILFGEEKPFVVSTSKLEETEIVDTFFDDGMVRYIKEENDVTQLNSNYELRFVNLSPENKKRIFDRYIQDREKYLPCLRSSRWEFLLKEGEYGYNTIYDKRFVKDWTSGVILGAENGEIRDFERDFFVDLFKELTSSSQKLTLRELTDREEWGWGCALSNLGDYIVDGWEGHLVVDKKLLPLVTELVDEHNKSIKKNPVRLKKRDK